MKPDIDLLRQANWIAAPSEIEVPIIFRKFNVNKAEHAEFLITSFGFFRLFINGNRIGNEFFLPSNSLYHKRILNKLTYPISDDFTYRTYFTKYDVLPYIKEGENLLEIKLANGWYRQNERTAEGELSFGDALATLYALIVTDSDGVHKIISDGTESCKECETVYSDLFIGEVIDANRKCDKLFNVNIIETDTVLTPEIAPPDREIRRIIPTLIYEDRNKKIFDAKENISGFASVKLNGDAGASVTLRFAEQLNEGELDFFSTGSNHICKSGRYQIQEDKFITDGKTRDYEPEFVWHTFRYIEVIGDISDITVKVIHSDIKKTGDFSSSSPELNFLYSAYIRTQLDNMHGGVPSDCPHRERLGYTGDGSLCAPAAMMSFDCKAFYRKWIRDIFDSQDCVTGHVNHTAPFAGGGGGPGGWGMAAITVPYHYFKIYGDITPAKENYHAMKKWVEYLLSRSERGLIVKEEDGGWCLGDWLPPDKCMIPAPFVNTALFIRALHMLEELSGELGYADAPYIGAIRKNAEEGILAKYYSAESGSFANGIQGADAYAIYAGLGNELTINRLREKYARLESFDTGFIGTDVLCEVLFELGEENSVFKLITSHAIGGYGHFFDKGLTTLPESWHADASLCHPMFGAVVRHFYTKFLGVVCHRDGICIRPKIPKNLEWAKGGLKTIHGNISVAFSRHDKNIDFEIHLPDGICSTLIFHQKILPLQPGINKIRIGDTRI